MAVLLATADNRRGPSLWSIAMASSRNDEREERRFNLRTLVIASAASATAAVVTSQLWIAGTWIAAALTPVLVTLISELLHRPTERIADRFTADRTALRDPAAPPVRDADPPPTPRPAEPGEAPVRIYRGSAPPRAPRRRRIAVGAVLATSALALLIAVVALTVPELIGGGAIGNSERRTTFIPTSRSASSNGKEERAPAGEDKQERTTPKQPPDEPPADRTTPTKPPAEETTTPTTPTEETTTPTDTSTAPATPPAEP
jgi:hypothetical protein